MWHKKGPEQEEPECPFMHTHDKFEEAHYFISQMVHTYHEPEPLRWNLNAFVQALRSVTFVMQKESKNLGIKEDWYQKERESMKADRLLKAFDDGRDVVVHKGMLEQSSTATVGVFRGRMLKLAISMPVPRDIPSKFLLKRVKLGMGLLLDAEHSEVGEQFGVRREWFVNALSDEEVVSACDKAWSRIGKVFSSAHEQVSRVFDGPSEHGHDIAKVSVLLESDLDPTLPAKWGWTKSEESNEEV